MSEGLEGGGLVCYVSSVRGLEVTLEGRQVQVQVQGVGYSACAMCAVLIGILLVQRSRTPAPYKLSQSREFSWVT